MSIGFISQFRRALALGTVASWLGVAGPCAVIAVAAQVIHAAAPASKDAAAISAGLALLKGGRLVEAQQAYAAITEKYPQNGEGWHGLAVTELLLDNDAAALRAMDEMQRLVKEKNHAQVFNASIVRLAGDLPAQALSDLAAYVKAHPDVLDEPMQNLMGYAISQAEIDEDIPLAKLDAARRVYVSQDEALNATRPGMKRWGATWLSVEEADRNLKIYDQAETKIRALMDEIATLERQGVEARRVVARATAAAKANRKKSRELTEARQRSDLLQTNLRVKQTDLARVRSEQPAPPFDEAIHPIAPDDLTPLVLATGQVFLRSASDVEDSAEVPAETTAPTERPRVGVGHDRPASTRVLTAAFPISANLFLAADSMLQGATSLQIKGQQQHNSRLTIVRRDAKSGLALLRVSGNGQAYLNLAEKCVEGEVQCIGFPTDSIFDPTAEPISGKATLAGEKLTIVTERPVGAVGGPVIVKGRVIGLIVRISKSDARQVEAIPVEALRAFLGDDKPAVAGVPPDIASAVVRIGPPE